MSMGTEYRLSGKVGEPHTLRLPTALPDTSVSCWELRANNHSRCTERPRRAVATAATRDGQAWYSAVEQSTRRGGDERWSCEKVQTWCPSTFMNAVSPCQSSTKCTVADTRSCMTELRTTIHNANTCWRKQVPRSNTSSRSSDCTGCQAPGCGLGSWHRSCTGWVSPSLSSHRSRCSALQVPAASAKANRGGRTSSHRCK